MELDGCTVLITGATGGVGSALVRRFDAAGSNVVAVDRPGSGAAIEADVRDGPTMAGIIDGLGRLDVVIANAGIGVGGRAIDIPVDGWRDSVDVNIGGVLNTVLPAYQRFGAARSGSIVLIASAAGLVGTPLLTPYAMTKHAIVGLGASLRHEAARHGVGVITVCPGPIDTALLDVEGATPGLNVRRYLTAVAGAPIRPDRLADLVVDAVQANRGLVIPGRAKLLWRLSRFAPRLTNREIARGMDAELRHAANTA